MHSIIVVPPGCRGPHDQLRLEPGERLVFGREVDRLEGGGGTRLVISHHGVSRIAGEIVAYGTFWTLSNLGKQTYAVENPESAGEHIKVAPGRLEAPVPFEFGRIVLPAAGDLLGLEVWAPQHDYLGVDPWLPDGQSTTPAFSLDTTKRYFLVLAALCEPRLRGASAHEPVPTAAELTERLSLVWPAVSRTAVHWNLDYLAVKLRLKSGPSAGDPGGRRNGIKESLVALALRFDLVGADDLGVLDPPHPQVRQ
ncbi:FHA domain-containing protein [Kitasatospora purpeofusca]|uniref:FHA domain-containing protein n=1 Tax=Kitasatospora purpeofusca TaxID=67352 RepID=UPI0035E216AC